MDPGSLALMIPIVALIAGAAVKVAQIHAGGKRGAPDEDLTERLAALEQEVTGLRGELGEAQERIDFTERLLAKDRDSKRLGDKG